MTTVSLPGSPEIRYGVFINDTQGNRLADITNNISEVDGACAVGTVGAAVLTLPIDIPPHLIAQDHIVEIWRFPHNGGGRLIADRLWWMRDFDIAGQGGVEYHKITCYDQNFLLASPDGQKGRVIAYDEGEPQTQKVDYLDDVMKAYVRENVGSLASDTDRRVTGFLTIEENKSQAPIAASSGTSRRNLLAVLNDLAALSADLGTYLAWDIVCTLPPSSIRFPAKFELAFRTYVGSRGADRRASSDNEFMIGPDFGNLGNWTLSTLTANQATSVYAVGQGVGAAAAVYNATAPDTVLLNSFMNRREYVQNSQAEDAEGIESDARAALRTNRARKFLTGTLQDPDLFGVAFDFGAYLTAQVKGQNFDCRLDAIRFKFSRQGEALMPVLRSDDV